MDPVATLRIVEVGDKPYIKRAFPEQTTFFSTFNGVGFNPEPGSCEITLGTLGAMLEALHDPQTSLIVCHPTFFSPWHWQWISRAIFDRRFLQGQFPLLRALGPQFLRTPFHAPLAVIDQEDLPVINRSNFFLLDRCTTYFKRELPCDRWRLFLKTGHANLPTPRFRRVKRYVERSRKVRPISMGLPMWKDHMPSAVIGTEKTADVFFAGRIEDSSWVRQTGYRELMALKERGIRIDIPDKPLPPEEFYQRCARAWLTWSPEGFGWDCFRHYEAPACGSVPVINLPSIERHQPLRDQEHAIYYPVEAGGLTDTIIAALADKARLQKIAEAGKIHVLAHHTPRALANYVVRTTLGLDDAGRPMGAAPP